MFRKVCFLILPAVWLAAGLPLFAQNGFTPGTPWTGQPGITESVSNIMAREVAHPKQELIGVRQPQPRLVPDRHNLPQNPNAIAASRWPPPGRAEVQAAGSTTPLTSQSVSTSFLGAQFSDTVVNGYGIIPPDSMADVGPSQILVCVNGRIRTFTKNGVADGALNANTDDFFASVLHGSSTSDPRVRYDRLSGRWFITMITVNTPNYVLIAVSSGPTITSSSSFTFYSFQADSRYFGDYDTLGVDANALYIGVNVFGRVKFVNTTAFVVNKADLLNGTLTVTTFSSLITSSHGPFTPQGVNNDDPNATMGYFIGVDANSYGTLVVRQISNPGGTPAISGNILISVPTTDAPMGGVPALGSSVGLDDLDDRLFATRMHNGSLWTAQNIEVNSGGVASSSGGRDGSRWYELTNMSSTPTLVQSGTLYDSAGSNPRNFWIPSCAMSGQGHMALGCSVAGNNEHAEIATAGRLAADTPGTIESPTTAVTTSSTYNISDSSNPHRWGDFSVTTVDPSDDMTIWTVQEYCNANDSWGVRVIKLLAPPPALPASCSPSTVTQGVANASVVITGLATNGSGFFDPGTGFTNHLAAGVDGGGVTVNSVTYNNPTNVTVNLTIDSNALTGARTVTVTNPDGQSVNSTTGILTVVAAGGSGQSPTITIPPTNQTVQCGGNAAFNVAATGTAPLSYQWSVDGVPVAGETSTNLTLTNVHLPDHLITVVVTNLYGSATNSAILTVQDTLAPVITLNGANPFYVELGSGFVDPGATAVDLCAGSVPVTATGIVNTNVIGTNTVTYTATDGNGNTNTATRAVIVRDTTPPTILWSFTNLVLAAGTNCDTAMPDVTGTNFIEATDLSGSLNISQNPTTNAILPLGTNLVIITVADASGNTAYSTNTIVVQDQTPPVILVEPQDQTNIVGTTASFTVGATACTPLTYQWFFDTAPLASQTNGTLTLSNVTTASAGNYFAVAGAEGGATTSRVASLTIQLISPNVALASSENPSGFKDSVNFTAGVAPTNAAGTIQFSTNGAAFDTEPLIAGMAVSTNISSLPRGTNIIAAVYSGDVNHSPATNTMEQVVTNHPPVAAAAFYNRLAGYPLGIAVAGLATNWSDADGDTVSLASLSVSTNGVTVTNNAGTLIYFDTNNVNDEFVCTISDGWGGTNFQVVHIAIVLTNVPPIITGVTSGSNGTVTLNLAGAPGYTYILDTTTNLTPPAAWQPLATNTLGTNGLWQFTDGGATNFPQRFYRLMLAP